MSYIIKRARTSDTERRFYAEVYRHRDGKSWSTVYTRTLAEAEEKAFRLMEQLPR